MTGLQAFRVFTDVQDALRAAYDKPPAFIGYRRRTDDWVIFTPTDAQPEIIPALFIAAQGKQPMPLSAIGSDTMDALAMVTIEAILDRGRKQGP